MFKYNLFNPQTFDRAGFSDMYELCFGQKVSEDYFKWKYENNPAGKVIGFIAASDATVAGFYGIIPETYLINGKPCKVYQSMDTMTHPSYQKKGLFTTLAGKTYEEAFINDPNALIIGIPGSNSFYGFVNKLNWKALHHFSFTFIHRSIYKTFNALSAKSLYRVEKINDFYNPSVATFLEKSIKYDVKIQATVNSSFLDWRIKQHPHIHYESLGFYINSQLVGMVIYHITENTTCFIDWIEVINETDKKHVLRSFCSHVFCHHDVKLIYTWKPVNKKKIAPFRSLGFFTNPFKKGPFSYRVPFIVYSKTNEINGVNLYDIQNYDLQPIIQD